MLGACSLAIRSVFVLFGGVCGDEAFKVTVGNLRVAGMFVCGSHLSCACACVYHRIKCVQLHALHACTLRTAWHLHVRRAGTHVEVGPSVTREQQL